MLLISLFQESRHITNLLTSPIPRILQVQWTIQVFFLLLILASLHVSLSQTMRIFVVVTKKCGKMCLKADSLPRQTFLSLSFNTFPFCWKSDLKWCLDWHRNCFIVQVRASQRQFAHNNCDKMQAYLYQEYKLTYSTHKCILIINIHITCLLQSWCSYSNYLQMKNMTPYTQYQ